MGVRQRQCGRGAAEDARLAVVAVRGVAGYSGILAALHWREGHPGEGQEVDVAELDAMVSTFAPALLRGQYTGVAQERRKDADMTAGPVPVADGYFALTISRAHFWRDSMNLLGLHDLAEDERWGSGEFRAKHKDEYVRRVEAAMSSWTKMELFEELASHRVVAGPVLSMEELIANPHLRAREFWVTPEGSDTTRVRGAAGAALAHAVGAAGDDARGRCGRCERAGHGGGGGAMNGPLAGLRGIVLTQAWAGTYCTNLLGYLGADVVQVEVTKRLDSWRGAYDSTMPVALQSVATAEHPWNCNPLYNSVNLNKRCVTLDLQTAAGIDVFRRLLPFADFVAENFSPRVLGNLGISFNEMRAIKPDVILCSLSAYGNLGPWTNAPGIGGTIEPTSGQSALNGYAGGPPLNSGQMYPDAVAGMTGCAAILTAIHHRDRTGEGQYIDLSMQDACLAFAGDAALEFALTGRERERMGNRHAHFAPHGIYRCAGMSAGSPSRASRRGSGGRSAASRGRAGMRTRGSPRYKRGKPTKMLSTPRSAHGPRHTSGTTWRRGCWERG